MDYGDYMKEIDEDGATICVCKLHQSELCHRCTCDFREMNANARRERDHKGAVECWAPGCTKRGVKTCTKCGRARYCSKECQIADWTTKHKEECRQVQASGEQPRAHATSSTNTSTVPERHGPRGFRPRTITRTNGDTIEELPPGTKVTLPDNSGRDPPTPLKGTIVETNMNGVDNVTGKPLPTYLIQYKDGVCEELPCEDVHNEWSIDFIQNIPVVPKT